MQLLAPEESFAGCEEKWTAPPEHVWAPGVSMDDLNEGYYPDVEDIERFVTEEQSLVRIGDSPYFADMIQEKKDVFLWLPLLEQKPDWVRMAQGIGDCVSWGWELGGTAFLYGERKLGTADFPLVTGATEPIYGGSRVEARGGKLGGYSDGSYGAAAARWVNNWGFLLRLDYSQETGSSDDNLGEYDKGKAKNWGNFGCGGKDDQGRKDGLLDKFASRYPMQTTAVGTIVELVAAITNGYPVPVCSTVGFGKMRRNSQGVVRASGRWAHCMVILGLRWVNGKPQFRIFQSWGKSCSGPDPGIDHDSVSWCSWWATEEDVARILRAKDSYAITSQEGFVPRKLDWADVRKVGNTPRNPSGPDWVLAS